MTSKTDPPGGPGVGELERLGVHAKRVERPSNEAEAQAVLAAAFRDRQTVLVCGGGTALGAGLLPETVDVALDTTGMDRILAFDPQNLNVAILGGMTLAAVNDFLAGQGRGFFLPLDPPVADRATLGGTYAANASGPLRLLYGTVRDQALGVRGADARGQEIGFGGKTVKNVSGYDVTKFLAGSAGSLCLVTSLSFRVLPVPEASALCELAFTGRGPLEKFLAALRTSVLVPSAVLVTGPGGDGAAAGELRVLAGFEGHRDAVDRQCRDVTALASEHGGSAAAVPGRDAMLRGLAEAVDPAGLPADFVRFKANVPISAGPLAYESLTALARDSGASAVAAVLCAGTGVVTLTAAGLAAEAAQRLAGGVKQYAAAEGGFAVPVRAHREVVAAWGPRSEPAVHRLVLQPIKERLDPTAVFPPVA